MFKKNIYIFYHAVLLLIAVLALMFVKGRFASIFIIGIVQVVWFFIILFYFSPRNKFYILTNILSLFAAYIVFSTPTDMTLNKELALNLIVSIWVFPILFYFSPKCSKDDKWGKILWFIYSLSIWIAALFLFPLIVYKYAFSNPNLICIGMSVLSFIYVGNEIIKSVFGAKRS